MSVEEQIEKIEQQIEEKDCQKQELLLKEGRAYRCKQCGEVVLKGKEGFNSARKGLCFDCWSEEVKEAKRKELIEKFKNAKIVDIKPDDSPYSNPYEVETITVKVNEELYEIGATGGYGEISIEIRKVK